MLAPAAMEELKDNDIVALTPKGERDLLEPGTQLSPAQLEVLVLMGGHASVAQIRKRARGAARKNLAGHLAELIDMGLVRISSAGADGGIDPGDFFTLKTPARRPSAEDTVAALADADSEFLRENGYCVNLARRGGARARPAGKNLVVLIVDDDPDIGALLHKYLKLEGLETRMAGTPEEIEAAFRQPQRPDLVLLDVQLGRVDGFHVLAKMREHPATRAIPVIMLTGTTNREVVLQGILGGADGHVTKPFKIHPMVRAVKAVLGLDYDPDEQDWDLSL